MSNRTIIVTHNGKDYQGQLGTIKKTRFGVHEHYGIMTADIEVAFDGAGISIGGFCLDNPADSKGGDYSRTGTAYGLDHILRILETAGVDYWEQLPGTKIIVLYEGTSGWGGQGIGFAHAIKDKVLIFKEHAESWREREA